MRRRYLIAMLMGSLLGFCAQFAVDLRGYGVSTPKLYEMLTRKVDVGLNIDLYRQRRWQKLTATEKQRAELLTRQWIFLSWLWNYGTGAARAAFVGGLASILLLFASNRVQESRRSKNR